MPATPTLAFSLQRFFYEAKVGNGDFKLKLKDSTGNAQSHCKDMAIGKALETKPKLGQLIEEVNPKCFKASSFLMQNDSLALVAKNRMLLLQVVYYAKKCLCKIRQLRWGAARYAKDIGLSWFICHRCHGLNSNTVRLDVLDVQSVYSHDREALFGSGTFLPLESWKK